MPSPVPPRPRPPAAGAGARHDPWGLPATLGTWLEGGEHGPVVAVEPLHGGQISLTRRLVCASGHSYVLKVPSPTGGEIPMPADLYRREAEGLGALAAAGRLRTPMVHLVAADLLLLEDLGSAPPTPECYELAGRRLAEQHRRHRKERFGFATDNYLGLLPQRNAWDDDGHAFFAQHRILRYLEMPGCARAISTRDQARLERLATRLPELIPEQPACLLHGDLWHANMVTTGAGQPAVVDPAVYYGWPEAELSMVLGCGGVPDRFFSAYLETSPLEPGWRERAPVLHLREVLSTIAHFGALNRSVEHLVAVLDRFG